MEILKPDRLKFWHYSPISHLNTNSLENQKIGLGVILKDIPLDYFVISEI